MKKLATGLLAGTAALALSATALPSAVAVPSNDAPTARDAARAKPDNRTVPADQEAGAPPGEGTRHARERLGQGAQTLTDGTQVVEARRRRVRRVRPSTGTDKIWTVLSEFGTQGSRKLGTTPGPLHNEIPEPDRSEDNSTYGRGRLQQGPLRGAVQRRAASR